MTIFWPNFMFIAQFNHEILQIFEILYFRLIFCDFSNLVCKIHTYKKICDGKHHFSETLDIHQHYGRSYNLPLFWYAKT